MDEWEMEDKNKRPFSERSSGSIHGLDAMLEPSV